MKNEDKNVKAMPEENGTELTDKQLEQVNAGGVQTIVQDSGDGVTHFVPDFDG